MTTSTPTADSEVLALSAYGKARSTIQGAPLSADELRKTIAYWRACNYLSLGMIYLLRQSAAARAAAGRAHQESSAGTLGIEPRTVLHLHPSEPLIKKYDQDMIFLAGPGTWRARRSRARHISKALTPRSIPRKSEDYEGLREFFKQFSFPGGIGSHCTPETPGSIHEGGELGYVAFARLRRGFRQSRPDRRGGRR